MAYEAILWEFESSQALLLPSSIIGSAPASEVGMSWFDATGGSSIGHWCNGSMSAFDAEGFSSNPK